MSALNCATDTFFFEFIFFLRQACVIYWGYFINYRQRMSSPNETDDETLRSPLLFVHQFKYEMDHFPLNCDDITAPTAGSAGQCFDSSRIVDARCRLGALSCVKIRLEIVITVLLHDVIQGKSLALSNSFDRSIISNISNYLFLS
jgi:hypothetical protein